MTSIDPSDSNLADGSAVTRVLNSPPNAILNGSDAPSRLGDFVIEHEIGRGGMGVVYRAIEKGLGRPVALKVLPPSHRLSKSQISRFQIEARSAAQLSHDHIVPIYHIGYEEGIHYFAMRLVEGCDLEKLVRTTKQALFNQSSREPTSNRGKRSPTQPPVPSTVPSTVPSADTWIEKPLPRSKEAAKQDSIETVIDLSLAAHATSGHSHNPSGVRSAHQLCICIAQIGQAIADALHHAHQHGIVHRDIKPSNLMLDENNKVWVTDFGLAQLQGEAGLTKTGEFVGTLRYMSPEQASGRKVFIDHRTDIYSLGVTLYELASLEKACQGESPQELLRNLTFSTPKPLRKINPRLPKDFESIISKAIERNPSDRYQSAAEFANDLSRFANGQSLVIRRPQRIKKLLNWFVERPRIASVALSLVTLVCISLSVIAVLAKQTSNSARQRAELAEEMVEFREGQQLSTAAILAKDENPGLAVAAALAGAELVRGPQSDLALMAAVDGNHERTTIPLDMPAAGSLVLSPDGKRAIICVDPFEFRNTKQSATVIDLQTQKTIGQLESSTPITQAVYDPLNKFILTNSTSYRLESAAVGNDGEILYGALQLWDAQSLRLLKTMAVSPAMRIGQSSFSPSGQQLVLPSSQGSATVYDLPTFAISAVLPTAHSGAVLDALYSSDGTRIATWAKDATAVVWDAENVRKLHTIAYQTGLPRSATLAFTADHERLCISGSNGTIVVSLKDGNILFSRREKLIAVAARRQRMYVQGLDNSSIYALSATTGEIEDECLLPGFVRHAVLAQDGRTLAISSGENIYLYDTIEARHVATLRGHMDDVTSIQLHEREPRIASLGKDATLRLWNISSDLQSRTMSPVLEKRPPRVIASDANRNMIVVGNTRTSHTALLDYRQTDRPRAQLEGSFLLELSQKRAIAEQPGYCHLWQLETQRKLRSIELPRERTITRAIELSDSRVALICNLQQLLFWDVNDNTLSRISRTGEFVTALVKTGESHALFGLSDGDLWQIDFKTLKRERLFRFGPAITHLTLNPFSNHLLVTTRNRDVFGWNLDEQKIQYTLKNVDDRTPSIVPLPDGRCLSYGDNLSKSVKVWNLATGSVEFELPINAVEQVVVAPNSQSVVVRTTDRILHWRWDENQLQTIQDAPCSRLVGLGTQVLILPAINVRASNAGELKQPQPLTWNFDTRKIEPIQAPDLAPGRSIEADGDNVFWEKAESYGVAVVDLQTNENIGVIGNFRSPVSAASFSANGNELITVCQDGKLFATDIGTGQRKLIGDHQAKIISAFTSHDGRLMLAADATNEIRKWSLMEPYSFEKVGTDGKKVNWLGVSQGGTTGAAIIGKDDYLLWDLRTGAPTMRHANRAIHSAALSKDGSKLLLIADPVIAADVNQSVRSTETFVAEVIPLDGSKTSITVQAQAAAVDGAWFSNDEKFALLLANGSVSIFEASTGKLTQKITATRPITQLLNSTGATQLLYTIAGSQVTGWTATGTQKTAFSVASLLMDSSTLAQPPTLHTGGNQWYLLFNDDHLTKHPIDAVAYAKQIAPRKLTEKERKTILWSTDSERETRPQD